MSENTDRPRATLVSAARHLPPIDIDCSGWKRGPGPRARGNLVSAARHLPPIDVPMGPTAWLELVVSFDPGTPPVGVFEYTNRLVRAAATAAPGLDLTYDLARSRAEGDGVVVVLTPGRVGADTRDRLLNAVEAVRRATGVPVRVAA